MEKFADAAETWCSLGLGHDYEVSNLGRVRHAETGEIISPTKTRYGELVLNLKLEGSWSVRLVRALVAECFLGSKPPHHMIVHLDGDRTHCGSDNLAYVERRFNREDEPARSKSNRSRKLTDDQVREIRQRLDGGSRGRDLAEEFGVSAPHISLIRSGKKHKLLE